MLYRNILTDDDLSQITEAVFKVLERVGMMYQNERILDALEKAGAEVDRAAENAKLPRPMVEEVIEEQRRRGESAERQTWEGLNVPSRPRLGVQVAQFYYDYDKQETRAGNKADFIKMIHFGDVLDEGGSVGHCLLMSDVEAMIEPLEALALLIEHAHTPGNTYPHYVQQFDYLAEIGEIYANDRNRFLIGGIFITSPLRICKRAADFMVRRLDLGLSCGVGNMPVIGASAPVSLAGSIVVSAAEFLGAWTAMRALEPDTPLSAGTGAGSTDMRTGNSSFSSPEAMLLNFGTVEFFRRACATHINIAGASDYSDARVPGLSAAYEKALKAMTVAAFTGRHPGVGQGMLESGKTLSPAQLLLDREMTDHVRRLASPIEVNDDTIALSTIEEVGLGIGKTYFDADHTLSNFRKEVWLPEFLDRSVWEGYAKEKAKEAETVDRANARFKELLAHYEQPEVDQDMLKAVRGVVEKAKRNV